jgi:phage tail-like protein
MSDPFTDQTIPAFYFVLDVGGKRMGAFTECTLPVIEWEVEEVKEGGLNSFIHQIPGRRKSARVTLKNGVGKSELMDWFIETVGGKWVRKTVTVTLQDYKGKKVLSWNLKDAYPIKWTGPQLKSDTSAIAIQTFDLAAGEVTVAK